MSSKDDNLSRRALLRGRFIGNILGHVSDAVQSRIAPGVEAAQPPAAPVIPAAQQSPRYQKAFPILRPPGAIEENAFLAGCTKCDACVQACPHDAIVHAPVRFRRAAGTPMIDPSPTSSVSGGQPCLMCEDFPCIAACEPGVLRMDMPKTMGIARIDMQTCLAYQHSFCTVCSEQCPVAGAIEVIAGKPRIIEDVCTGCGVCHHVCPAPANAVLLMPLADRPLPPVEPATPGPPAPSETRHDEPR